MIKKPKDPVNMCLFYLQIQFLRSKMVDVSISNNEFLLRKRFCSLYSRLFVITVIVNTLTISYNSGDTFTKGIYMYLTCVGSDQILCFLLKSIIEGFHKIWKTIPLALHISEVLTRYFVSKINFKMSEKQYFLELTFERRQILKIIGPIREKNQFC